MSGRAGRATNFCKEEELLLISLVDKYKNIIESKKSNAGSWKEKEMAWKKVEAEFNASCKANGVRQLKVLKEKYRNLKKKTKEKFSKTKMELTKTGGGVYKPPIVTEIEEGIKSILGDQQVCGLQNNFDSDAQFNAIEPSHLPEIVEISSMDIVLEESLSPVKNFDKDKIYEVTKSEKCSTKATECENINEKEREPQQGSSWSNYSSKDLKTPVSKKLRLEENSCQSVTKKTITKKFNNKNSVLITEKLDFVRLQKEKFLEEHDIKMQIYKLKLSLLKKQ